MAVDPLQKGRIAVTDEVGNGALVHAAVEQNRYIVVSERMQMEAFGKPDVCIEPFQTLGERIRVDRRAARGSEEVVGGFCVTLLRVGDKLGGDLSVSDDGTLSALSWSAHPVRCDGTAASLHMFFSYCVVSSKKKDIETKKSRPIKSVSSLPRYSII